MTYVKENIFETFTFYRLPRGHHKHLKSTNMLERLKEEIKHCTRVGRILPNQVSCLRLWSWSCPVSVDCFRLDRDSQ